MIVNKVILDWFWKPLFTLLVKNLFVLTIISTYSNCLRPCWEKIFCRWEKNRTIRNTVPLFNQWLYTISEKLKIPFQCCSELTWNVLIFWRFLASKCSYFVPVNNKQLFRPSIILSNWGYKIFFNTTIEEYMHRWKTIYIRLQKMTLKAFRSFFVLTF